MYVEQRGRNVRERLGRVGEALASRAVGGEFAGRLQIDACQIANGAVVLRIAEPSERHVAGVAGSGTRFRIQEFARPGDQLFAFVVRRLRLALRGHLAGFELFDNVLPRLQILANQVDRSESLQVEAALLDLR